LPKDITTNNKIKEGLYEYLGGSLKVMQMMAIDHKTNTAYWIVIEITMKILP
jgi:hypothetical protein